MRQVSQTQLQSLMSETTQEVYLMFLEIDHPSMSTPLRCVNNTEDITRNNNNYIGFPFAISLPSDSEEAPKVTLTIDNVDQRVIQVIRPLTSKPSIMIGWALDSSPDTTEVGPYTMKLKQVDYDAQTISGTIGYDEDFLNRKVPALNFTPQTAHGMFS